MSAPFLHYGHQVVDDDDVAAVIKALKSDWLTTGPAVAEFESDLAAATGARYAVACNSGTAALYLAFRGLRPEAGDCVVVPAITFVATASAAVLAGLDVVFADVDPDTGLMNEDHLQAAIKRAGKSGIRAVCPVHLGGRISDPVALQKFAASKDLAVVEDACHALGTEYGNGHRVGDCSHSVVTCFSFHPVKTVTTGEGGAVTTNSKELANHMRLICSHGLNRRAEDMHNRTLAFSSDGAMNPWYYEVDEISHNFRISDINCALGRSQLRKLPAFVDARRTLMTLYAERLGPLRPYVRLIESGPASNPGWHLCSVLVDFSALSIERATLMKRMRDRGIGTQVHYIPVHLQPYYRKREPSLALPGADAYYARTLSLPLWPSMTASEVERVVDVLKDSISKTSA